MESTHYTPHIFSFCALSVLGNAVISMPFYKRGGFLFVLISAVLSLVLILLTTLLTNQSSKSNAVFYVTATVVSAAAVYGAVITFSDYIRFLKTVQMPPTSVYLLSAVLVLVIVFFVLNSTSAIYKYSLLVSVIGATMIVICFVGGIKNFDFSGFKESFLNPNFNIKDFLRCFSSLAVIPFFVSLKLKKSYTNPLVLGTAAGFFVLALCLAQSVFTLGFASNIPYPYLNAVSVISSGSLFTRLDGFAYFIFFAAAIIKIVLCIKAVCLTAKAVYNKIH